MLSTIPAPTVVQPSRDVGAGRIVKVKSGAPGYVKRIYELTFRGHELVSKRLVDTQRKAAQPALMLMGGAGFEISRSSFSRVRVLTMVATGYDPSPRTIRGGKGVTKMGLRAKYGVVAVDPRVVPLGTLLFVEGYGLAVAADIGRAIKGNRIDLCYNSRSQALAVGRKKVVVHVFDKPIR